MKALYSLFLTLSFIYAKDITISNHKYMILEDRYEEYGEKGVISNFYRDGSRKAFLSFITYEKSGECGKRDYEEAVYALNGSKITIYTKWSGYTMSGYRKMIYDIKDERAILLLSRIYILDKSTKESIQDINYLQNGAKDTNQQEQLDEYVSSLERQYRGEFVFKKAKDSLIDEVDRAFQSRLFHY